MIGIFFYVRCIDIWCIHIMECLKWCWWLVLVILLLLQAYPIKILRRTSLHPLIWKKVWKALFCILKQVSFALLNKMICIFCFTRFAVRFNRSNERKKSCKRTQLITINRFGWLARCAFAFIQSYWVIVIWSSFAQFFFPFRYRCRRCCVVDVIVVIIIIFFLLLFSSVCIHIFTEPPICYSLPFPANCSYFITGRRKFFSHSVGDWVYYL